MITSANVTGASATPDAKSIESILSADEREPVTELDTSETPDSTTTDANAAKAAPADGTTPDGTADKTGKEPDTTTTAKDGKSDEDPAEPKTLTQDELDKVARESLGLTPKEPNTAEHWRKKYQASSDEGVKLAQKTERINARLKEMGLKLIDGEEKADLVADDTYVATKTDTLVKDISGKLTQAEKDLALDEPDKFAALIADKVLKATLRPTPTISARDIKIADTAKKLVRDEVIAAKGADGKPELPDFDKLEPYVNNLRDDQQTPEDFRKFMDSSESNYKYGLKLLYGRVHQRVAPLIAEQLDAKRKNEEKRKAAKEDASLTSEGTRSGRTRKVSSDKDEASEIATAKSVW